MSSLEAIEPFLKKSLCTLLLEKQLKSVWEKSGKWLAVKGIDMSSNNLIN